MNKDRLVGTVLWWDNELHRGRISSGGEEFFVDYRAVLGADTLYEHQQVLFEAKDDPILGGKKATRVALVES